MAGTENPYSDLVAPSDSPEAKKTEGTTGTAWEKSSSENPYSDLVIPSDSPETEKTEVTTGTAWELTTEAAKVEAEQLKIQVEWERIHEFLDQIAGSEEFHKYHEAAIADTNKMVEKSSEEIWAAISTLNFTGDFVELWGKIKTEAQHILSLSEGAEISFQNDDFNPEGGSFVFSSKQEALLFLYAHGVSIIQTKKFMDENPGVMQKIQDFFSSENLSSVGNTIRWAGIWLFLIGYVGFSTMKSVRRGFNVFNISSTNGEGHRFWRFHIKPKGDYLDDAKFTGDAATSKEAGELERRNNMIMKAKNVFQGDEYRMKLLDNGLSTRVLDQKMDGVSKPGPYNEGTFWRQLRNIVDGRWILGKSVDVMGKAFYFNSETSHWLVKGTTEKIEKAVTLKKEVLEYFRTSTDFDDMKTYIELSLDISNTDEDIFDRKLEEFKKSVERWDVAYLYKKNQTKEKAIAEIRKRMFQATWIKRTDYKNVFWPNGEAAKLKWDDVKIQESGIVKLENHSNIIEARAIQAAVYGNAYNSESVKIELNSFFAGIWDGAWKHNYTYYQASTIISQILSWKTTAEAISITSKTYQGPKGLEKLKSLYSQPTSLFHWYIEEIPKIKRNIILKIENTTDIAELQKLKDILAGYVYDKDGKVISGWNEVSIAIEKRFSELKIELTLPVRTETEAKIIVEDSVDIPVETKVDSLSLWEKTTLKAELHWFIDVMKEIWVLQWWDAKYFIQLKGEVTKWINSGLIKNVWDLLKIELRGKNIPLELTLHDTRFDTMPGIETLREHAKTDISRISIEDIWNIFKHLKIKL